METSLAELENISAHHLYISHLDTDDYDDDGQSSLAESTISTVDLDYSQLDRFGFIVVNEQQLPGEGNREQEKRSKREARRALKWLEMIKSLESKPLSQWPHEHRKFEERLVKGIPDCLRNKLWSTFCLQDGEAPTLPPYNYRELYLKISGFERQIDLDIERTLRDHVLFKIRFSTAQVSLFKMLVAYSNLDPAVGYCQGMSTVGAFLLLYFEEEMAFAVLRHILQRDRLRTLYLTGFPLLFETFFLQEQLMSKFTPRLHQRLTQLNISPSIYATKWYLTLFLGFPFPLATRIWDLFLYYGFDILIVIAIAMLKINEERLMPMEYEQAMQFLSRLPDQPFVEETKLLRLTHLIWTRLVPCMEHHRLESLNCTAEAGKVWQQSVFAKLRVSYQRKRSVDK